jgi:hypothetical protein
MQSEQWLNSITAGSMGRLCMLSCLLSPTSGNRAVGSTRWGMVTLGWGGHLEFQILLCDVGVDHDNGFLYSSVFFLGNVPEVASATSCTCDPYPGTSDGSCTGGDPGAGTSGPSCPDFLDPKTPIP